MLEKLSEKFAKAPSAADYEGENKTGGASGFGNTENHLEKKENSSVVKIERSVCC